MDQDLRSLERQAAQGDHHAAARLLTERQRCGQLVLPPLPLPPTIPYGGAVGTRLQLAALAGDEVARIALDPKLNRWVNPNDSDMVTIPGVDRYDARGFVDVTLRKFGVVPAIAAVIGHARHNLMHVEWAPPEGPCQCGERDTCYHCTNFWEVKDHVDQALDVFEDWICEPTSSNLVKLEGRADYGRRYQRMLEGCDALASSHARGVEIFWEGFDCLRQGVNSSVIGGSLRRSVRDYARGDYW
jgi:hypothetical protein